MAKIKIKVTKLAYYRDNLVYPNEVIDYYEEKLPSWGTLADGKAVKNQEKTLDNVGQDVKDDVKTPKNPDEKDEAVLDNVGQNEQNTVNGEQNAEENEQNAPKPEQCEEKSEVQLQAELDALLDESVQKGIVLENAENKTIDEKIAELKDLLGKV